MSCNGNQAAQRDRMTDANVADYCDRLKKYPTLRIDA